jgi:hypothetical protein
MYGNPTGLAALTLVTFSPKCIWLAQQARYYSAALAFSTLALWSLLRLRDAPRRRDFALAGLVLVLLFHTSSLAFAIVGLTSLALAPPILRQRGWRSGVGVALAVLTAGILPWLLWTGYLQHSGRIPMARSLLEFEDYFLYARAHSGRIAAGLAGLLLLALAWRRRERLPARLSREVKAIRAPLVLLATWIPTAYFGFQMLVPAASCSLVRMSHNLLASSILACAVGTTFVARLILPSAAAPAAVSASLALLLGSGSFLNWQRRNPYEAKAIKETIEVLRAREFSADARIYSLPYQQFCLSFYTGLPVQSIAPVRREFLDSYSGEILLLEVASRLPAPPWSAVLREAGAHGARIGEHEARAWIPKLTALMIRAELSPLVHSFEPDPGLVPEWAAGAADSLRRGAETSLHGRFDYAIDNPAMFKGWEPLAFDDFWPAFFYRFVDPKRRSGEDLNYAGRLADAEALLLPSNWVVLRIPARG